MMARLLWLLSVAGCATGGPPGARFPEASAPTADQQAAAKPAAPPLSASLKEANALYVEGKAAGAVDYGRLTELLRAAVDRDPAGAYFGLGVVFQEQDQYAQAVQMYTRAIEADSNHSRAMANLGFVRIAQGDMEGALKVLGQAVSLDPFNAVARNNLARLHRRFARAARAAGRTEDSKKHFAKAVGNVRKVLAAAPQDLDAYNNLALIYYELRKYELAQLVCLNALKFQKPDARLHNNLGLVLLKLNKVTDALGQFRAALKVDPNHVPAHLNIGSITLSYRDYNTAFSHLDAVIQSEPKNLDALLSRAVALRGLTRFDEAKRGYEAALELDPENGQAWFNLAILNQQYLNNSEAAISNYERFLKTPNADDKALAAQVRKRIDNLRLMLKYEAESAAAERAQPKAPAEPSEPAPDEAGSQGSGDERAPQESDAGDEVPTNAPPEGDDAA